MIKFENSFRAVDILFFMLSVFTHLYGLALVLIFFTRSTLYWPNFVSILNALEEPYVAALGVYVVLKEIRKMEHKLSSRHYGELFVGAWFLLLVVSTLTIIASPYYQFDSVYEMIITNSLVTIIIYIGGRVHRP